MIHIPIGSLVCDRECFFPLLAHSNHQMVSLSLLLNSFNDSLVIRAINLHGLTENYRHQKFGEKSDHWNPQHNTFHSFILTISLAYRTELPTSVCGKVMFKDTYLRPTKHSPKRADAWQVGCKKRSLMSLLEGFLQTLFNHVTYPYVSS